MAHRGSNAMTDALMLVGGGVLGAGLALLFAPYSGEKSRKKIKRFGRTIGNKSDRVVRSISDFADTMGGRASKVANMWH
jgi:gas vesicle protein